MLGKFNLAWFGIIAVVNANITIDLSYEKLNLSEFKTDFIQNSNTLALQTTIKKPLTDFQDV